MMYMMVSTLGIEMEISTFNFTSAFDLVIANSSFHKREKHLVI